MDVEDKAYIPHAFQQCLIRECVREMIKQINVNKKSSRTMAVPKSPSRNKLYLVYRITKYLMFEEGKDCKNWFNNVEDDLKISGEMK